MTHPCTGCKMEKSCSEDCQVYKDYDARRRPAPIALSTAKWWDVEDALPKRSDWYIAMNSWGELLQYYYSMGHFRADDHKDSPPVNDIVFWVDIEVPEEITKWIIEERLHED